jgi:protein-S-isoprenylcysteine O-methyltransferase Ste14
MSYSISDFRLSRVLSLPTAILYSGTLLNQAYAILVNFPRPSNGFAYPGHFAALAGFSGACTLLSTPLLLPTPNPSSLQIIGNTLMSLSVSLFSWSVYTTQRGRLSAIFGGKTPNFVIDYGPFAYIRHPTYTAYLLGWFGALSALASREDAGWRALRVYIVPARTWRRVRCSARKMMARLISARSMRNTCAKSDIDGFLV